MGSRQLANVCKPSVKKVNCAVWGCLVKAMVFPVVMFGCESWTVKKLSAEELMHLNCGVEEDS